MFFDESVASFLSWEEVGVSRHAGDLYDPYGYALT